VELWDAQTGTLLSTLVGHTQGLTNGFFSPDDQRVVSSSDDGTVRLWDTHTPAARIDISIEENDAFLNRHGAVFSPDSRRVLVPIEGNAICYCDAATGREFGRIDCSSSIPQRGVRGALYPDWIKISADGTRIAEGGDAGGVAGVLDVDTGFPLGVLHLPEIRHGILRLSPDLKTVATWREADPQPLKLFEAQSGKLLREWPYVPEDAAFSLDGKRLAVLSDTEELKVFDTASGVEQSAFKLAESDAGERSLFFDRQGRVRITESGDGVTRIIDPASGAELLKISDHGHSASLGEFSPDEKRVFMVTHKTTYLLDAASGTDVAQFKFGEYAQGTFSPDYTRLLLCDAWADLNVLDSIPYAQRYEENLRRGGDLGKARRAAREALDSSEMRIQAAAARIRADRNMTDPVRRLALDELFIERSARSERVARLLNQFALLADAVAAIEADASLSPGVRSDLIEIARARGDDPLRINDVAWRLVLPTTAPADARRTALRAAQTAAAAASPDWSTLNTLALAHYRNENYHDALATEEQARNYRKDPEPADLAIIAMSQQKLGRRDDAIASLDNLRHEMLKPSNAKDEEAQALLKETEELFLGSGPTTAPATAPTAN
jgi:WD40 repeat protein